jgi:hypothetical protein
MIKNACIDTAIHLEKSYSDKIIQQKKLAENAEALGKHLYGKKQRMYNIKEHIEERHDDVKKIY